MVEAPQVSITQTLTLNDAYKETHASFAIGLDVVRRQT